MQEPQRPDRSPRPPARSPETRPATRPETPLASEAQGASVPPRPSTPPTGALPVVPAPATAPPASAPPLASTPQPPATPPHPPTGARRVARVPQRPLGDVPKMPAVDRTPAQVTEPAHATEAAEDTSPAVIIRRAVTGVPGVLGVGEPVSRALGRLAQAIGQDSSAGVSVTQGNAELAVDLGIVVSYTYPLRDTAARVQQAVAAALADAGRTLAEVNVDVLEVAADEKNPSPGTVPAPLGGADQAASGSIPGHVRVGSRALSSTAQQLAARAFVVPVNRVGISLRDDAGDLALRLNLPLPVRPLSATAPSAAPEPVPGADGEAASLRERALGLRAPLRRDFEAVTGARLSRVDVQVTGVIFDDADAVPAKTKNTLTTQESPA